MNARPPRITPGTGTATFTVRGNAAEYLLEVAGLSGPVTVAHIQIGDTETVGGPPVVSMPLSAASGRVAVGSIDLGRPMTFNTLTISGDSLRALFERGTAYVNVYTAAFPSGEIRGQILRR